MNAYRLGFNGHRRGQEAAELDAAGAALGALGMLAFALVFFIVVICGRPLWQGLFVGMGVIGCFHMSGLFMRRCDCRWP